MKKPFREQHACARPPRTDSRPVHDFDLGTKGPDELHQRSGESGVNGMRGSPSLILFYRAEGSIGSVDSRSLIGPEDQDVGETKVQSSLRLVSGMRRHHVRAAVSIRRKQDG